jgi:hypothetical protein
MSRRALSMIPLLFALAGCSKKAEVNLRLVEYGSKKPICEGVEFFGQAAKQGAATTPPQSAPKLAFEKKGECSFVLSPAPALGDDEILTVRIKKAGYVDGTWMLAGRALKDAAVLEKMTANPIELVKK